MRSVVDLQRMHRGEDRRRLADLAFLAQEAVLEVAVAAALADARAVATDADRPAHDQVDRAHLARRHRAAVPAGAGDARRERGALPEALRVDLDEALLGAQARHRHVDDLALLQREAAHGELRRVGVHLHDQRAAPDGHLAQQLRRLLGADEVRNAPAAEREAARRLPAQSSSRPSGGSPPSSSCVDPAMRGVTVRLFGTIGSGGVNSERPASVVRETSRDDEEAGVRHHAMLRAQARGRARARSGATSRTSRPPRSLRALVSASTSDFTCSTVGTKAVEHAAGTQGLRGTIEQLPWLGEIDDHAIDVALVDAVEGVRDAQGPVGRGPVEAGDQNLVRNTQMLQQH